MEGNVTIYECNMPLEVITPMGPGHIWLVKDYGLEMNTLYSVIIKSGKMQGMIFDFSNSDIRVSKNYSLGRGQWSELKEKLTRRVVKAK